MRDFQPASAADAAIYKAGSRRSCSSFPIGCCIAVEPFFGEGERRTLSCNMDVKFNEPD